MPKLSLEKVQQATVKNLDQSKVDEAVNIHRGPLRPLRETISVMPQGVQGDYSRPTPARNFETIEEMRARIFPEGGPQEQAVPMGDITLGFLPSHAVAESTMLPGMDRLQMDPAPPEHDTTFDEAEAALGELTPEQESAAQQAVPAGEFGVDPDDLSSRGILFGTGAVRGLTAGNIDVGSEDLGDSTGSKIASATGEAAGATGALLAGGAVTGATGAGPMLRGAMTLGGFSAAHPGTIGDRAIAGLSGAATGAAFGGLPILPGIGRAAQSKVAGPFVDFGTMYAMNKASGMDDRDAIINAGAMTAAGRATHLGGRGESNPVSPRESMSAESSALKRMAVPFRVGRDILTSKKGEPVGDFMHLVEEQRAANPNLKTDEVLSRFEAGDSGPFQLMTDIATHSLDGRLHKGQRKELSKHVGQRDIEGKDAKKDAMRRDELDKTMPKDWVTALRKKLLLDKKPSDIVDWRRMFQAIGGGEVASANPADHLIRFTERVHRTGKKFQEDLYSSFFGDSANTLSEHDIKALGEYMIYRSLANDAKTPAKSKDLFEQADAVAARFQDPEAVSAVHQGWRSLLDKTYEGSAAVKSRLSGGKINRRQEYFPITRRSPSGIKERAEAFVDRAARRGETAETLDGDLYLGHERFRDGKMDIGSIETDPRVAIAKHVKDLSRGVVNRLGVYEARQFADHLELYGYKSSAKVLREYATSALEGKETGSVKKIQGLGDRFGIGGKVVAEGIGDFAQAIRSAVFTGNIMWSLGTQGSSAALAAGKYPEHMAKAQVNYLNPKFRQMAEQLHVMQMKDRPHGQATDVGRASDPVEAVRLGAKTAKQKVTDGLNFLSRAIEKETGYYSAAIAFERGKSLGLQGKDLANYMSDFVAKTQSMYDAYNRANILNSSIIGGLFPPRS